MKHTSITTSTPGKIHLLGEHSVVWGKPALLTTVDLRIKVTISQANTSKVDLDSLEVRKIIEPIVKKHLKIKDIPPYQLTISSQIPIGSGLGSSAAVSAAYIAALLTFLKVNWGKNLVNDLTYEAEKVFHGNPSGGDNSTVVFGGLVWFRRETPNLKIIQPVPFTIPHKLSKNFILINTGKPQETTKQMVEEVSSKFKVQNAKFRKIFDNQEQLVRDLLLALRENNENQLIQIIRQGEKNLESIGVVSKLSQDIIRKIEKANGAAKICGAGGKTGPTGVLLCYHPQPNIIANIAKSLNLDYFKTNLGVKGLKQE